MATPAQADAHRRAVGDLVALATRDLVAFWRSLDVAEPKAASEALQRVMPDLTAGYAGAAAAVAADWYDELRDEAQAPGRYRAVLAAPPSVDRAGALVRWAVGDLFGARPDPAGALSKLSGGLQRVVADGSRETVRISAVGDPAGARYARHASANACAFCRMLATRGAVYATQTTAAKSHDNCHCVPMPVWGGAFDEAPYVQQWRDAYDDARGEVGGGTKPILAEMRRTLGAS